MRFRVYLLGLIFVVSPSYADKSILDIVQYRVATQIADTDFGQSISISTELRKLLTHKIGITLRAGFSDFNGDSSNFDASAQSALFGMFYRKNDIGVLNIDHVISKSETNFFDDTVKNTSLSATYFSDNVHIHLIRSKLVSEIVGSNNTSNIGISYYLNNNLRLRYVKFGMDQGDRSFASISIQPTSFDNTLLLSLGFLDTDNNDSVIFTLAYYFNLKADLILRVR